MKICVIGLGYIGLPTAAMFANSHHQVVGVDKYQAIVDALNHGKIIIEEPGLAEYIATTVEQGHLTASLTPCEADAFIIAVPTPITAAKKADMSYVQSATKDIVPYLRKGNIVVLESTSPVNTVEQLMLPILERSGLEIGVDLFVGHSPERVIPGNILYELVHNSRIAGGINPESSERIAQLYESFVQGEVFRTNVRTAEMAKLTENTFRDINIAFANELAKICENIGIDVWELISLTNKHPRVNIHQPGPGVGGHCIAVDPWFIVEKQPETALLIHQARKINDSMPHYVLEKALKLLAGVDKPQVAILGVTYKPDVDDTRESPILELIELMKQRGISVQPHDPHAFGYDNTLEQAAKGADLLILGVNHTEYRTLDWSALAPLMRRKAVLDTRNFIDCQAAADAGFSITRLGAK